MTTARRFLPKKVSDLISFLSLLVVEQDDVANTEKHKKSISPSKKKKSGDSLVQTTLSSDDEPVCVL